MGDPRLDGSRIRTWTEAIGLIAVVASLVFVGLEIRQNAEATRAATAQSLNDGWLEWNLRMATPDRWEVVAHLRELDDLSEASYEDAQALRSLMRSIFQHWSNLHWQVTSVRTRTVTRTTDNSRMHSPQSTSPSATA